MITKNEYIIISSYRDVIERAIKNHSYTNFPIEAKEQLFTIAEKNGVKECRHCQAGLFNIISWAYRRLLEYEKENQKNKRRTKKSV